MVRKHSIKASAQIPAPEILAEISVQLLDQAQVLEERFTLHDLVLNLRLAALVTNKILAIRTEIEIIANSCRDRSTVHALRMLLDSEDQDPTVEPGWQSYENLTKLSGRLRELGELLDKGGNTSADVLRSGALAINHLAGLRFTVAEIAAATDQDGDAIRNALIAAIAEDVTA